MMQQHDRQQAQQLRRHRGEPRGVFPKQPVELSPELEELRNQFMNAWLEELPQKYSVVERFNHRYPLRGVDTGQHYRTLDIGAGRGEHILYEDLSHQDYYALELRQNVAENIEQKFPQVKAVIGDIQTRTEFDDDMFDRVLAIHILEHLPDLPSALDEVKRILKPGGQFSVLIPCDPGLAYSIARNISARPMFERLYEAPYDFFIAAEHINNPSEIRAELEKRFTFQHSQHFPLFVPIEPFNLIIGHTLTY